MVRQPLVDDEQRHGEGRSPQALVVRWERQERVLRADVLQLHVENTTAREIDAELSLLLSAPDGQRVEEPLRRHTFQAKEKLTLPLSVAALPMQSSGLGTVLSVVARYDVHGNGVGGIDVSPPATMRISSHSPQRYITHDDGFLSAVVRTAQEEARENARRYLASAPPRLTEVRGFAARAVSRAQAAAAQQQLVVSFAPGAPRPAGAPQSTPATPTRSAPSLE